MIRVRKAAERRHFDHGWLDTYHNPSDNLPDRSKP